MSGGKVGRISEREFTERLDAIYARLADEVASGVSESEATRRARHAELDAIIDLRLGVDFPRERREAIRAAKEETEARRAQFTRAVAAGSIPPAQLPLEAHALAEDLRGRLAVVLTPAELKEFIGEGELPLIPPDEMT